MTSRRDLPICTRISSSSFSRLGEECVGGGKERDRKDKEGFDVMAKCKKKVYACAWDSIGHGADLDANACLHLAVLQDDVAPLLVARLLKGKLLALWWSMGISKTVAEDEDAEIRSPNLLGRLGRVLQAAHKAAGTVVGPCIARNALKAKGQ